jgi:lipopolysaccharide transport system ATP-binding protein
MAETVVVNQLGKRFRRFHKDRPYTLQEAFTRGFTGVTPIDWFWALREVSFTVKQGRMLGIIGFNGAGKSTLLRLIGGVGRPDEGGVEVNGRIGGLLELGAGFHPDLSGKENVFINGVISGLTRQEVRQRYESIISFAELESAIDEPLRTYSTGMRMRLGFSIAVHTDPEILLIDEVLAVGDIGFQRKCFNRINDFLARGCTIIIVSHNTDHITGLCDEAIWLHSGCIKARGDPNNVVNNFVSAMNNGREQTNMKVS